MWLYCIVMFWFVLSLKSLIATFSQSCVSLALVALNRGCGTPLLVLRLFRFMLAKESKQGLVFLP